MHIFIWASVFALFTLFWFHCTSPYCIMKTITIPLLESYLRQCFPNFLTVAFPVTGHFHFSHLFLVFKIINSLAPATLSLWSFPPCYSFDFWNAVVLSIASTWTLILYRPLPCVLNEFSFLTSARNTFHHYSKLPYILLLIFFFNTNWLSFKPIKHYGISFV